MLYTVKVGYKVLIKKKRKILKKQIPDFPIQGTTSLSGYNVDYGSGWQFASP